jgi:5-methylcytosine-specific restriction endonuclease McrA
MTRPSNHRARNKKDLLIERDGSSCYYCGKPKLFGRSAHVDHLTPLAKGGADSLDNLVLACARCNTQKSSSNLEEYITRRLLQLLREKDRLLELAKKHELT